MQDLHDALSWSPPNSHELTLRNSFLDYKEAYNSLVCPPEKPLLFAASEADPAQVARRPARVVIRLPFPKKSENKKLSRQRTSVRANEPSFRRNLFSVQEKPATAMPDY